MEPTMKAGTGLSKCIHHLHSPTLILPPTILTTTIPYLTDLMIAINQSIKRWITCMTSAGPSRARGGWKWSFPWTEANSKFPTTNWPSACASAMSAKAAAVPAVAGRSERPMRPSSPPPLHLDQQQQQRRQRRCRNRLHRHLMRRAAARKKGARLIRRNVLLVVIL